MIWLLVAYAVFANATSVWVRRSNTGDEYLMGGRESSALYVSFGIFTLIGGGELVTMASLGYSFGFSALALFIGTTLSFIVLGVFSSRVRDSYDKTLPLSLPDYFHEKFGKSAGRIVFIFSFIVFFGLLVMQFLALGEILSPMFGIPSWQVIVFSSAIALSYLLIGGFRVVMTTDLFQGIAMFILLPFLLLAVSFKMPGIIYYPVVAKSMPLGAWASLVLSGFFGGFASADVWQRAFAAKNNKGARTGLIAGGWMILAYGFLLAEVGVLARNSSLISDADSAFTSVLFSLLPPWGSILAVLLVLVVILSTADTEIFLLSGMIERERLRLIGVDTGQKISHSESTAYSRVWLFVITVIGTIVALFAGNVVTLYSWILSIGLVIAPVICLSLFFKLSSRYVNIALFANTLAFFIIAFSNIISMDHAYLVAVPSLILLAIWPK